MQKRFDELSRSAAAGDSRREALGRLAVLAALALLGPLGLDAQAAPGQTFCHTAKDCPPDYVCCKCGGKCKSANAKICAPAGWCGAACGCPDPG